MTTNFRTKPNPLLQYTVGPTFPPSSLPHHAPAHAQSSPQHQRHHSNPQMAASMAMYGAQGGQAGGAGMMPPPLNLGFGATAGLAPHPHPPHHPQPSTMQPMQLAPGQLSIPPVMQMQMPGASGGVLLPTFPPLTDARRSVLHYAAVSAQLLSTASL